MKKTIIRLRLILAVCLLLQLLHVKPLHAQRWWYVPDSEKIEVPPNAAPGYVLKTSLLSPFLEVGTFRLAYEHPVGSNLSLQAELGYIYRYTYGQQKLNTDKLNFDFKAEARFYPEQSVIFGLYTGPALYFRNLNYMEGTLRGGNDPGDPSYVDYSQNVQYRRNNYSLLWVAGLQPIIAGRIAIDIHGGAGFTLEDTRFTGSNLPSAVVYVPHNSSTVSFTGTFGIQVGYLLRSCTLLPE